MGTPRSGRRRVLILAAIAAGLLVGTVPVIHYAIPYKRHLEVQRQLAAFKADPAYDTANALADLLATGGVTPEDSQEILRTWLDLRVSGEDPYGPNGCVGYWLASGNETSLRLRNDATLRFTHWKAALQVPGLTSPGEQVESQGWVISSFLDKTKNGSYEPTPSPTIVVSKTGVYQGVVFFEGTAQAFNKNGTVRIHPPGLMEKALIFLGMADDPDKHPPQYRCLVEVPYSFRIEEGAWTPPARK